MWEGKLMLKSNEKTKKIGKIIVILCAIIIVTLTCVFVTSQDRRTYFEYRFLTNNYQEQYKGLSTLNVLDSQKQANKFFKKRAKSLLSEKKYMAVINMMRNEARYVTSYDQSVYGYEFFDKGLEKIYNEALYQYSVECINKNEDIGTAVKLLISLGDYKDSAKIVAERSGEEE